MTIKFKRNGKFVTYKENVLRSLSREKLKSIKGEIQSNIEYVSAKRTEFEANADDENTKDYYMTISNFKQITARLRGYITYLNSILNDIQESDLKEREHWLWCFYMTVKNSSNKRKFNKIINATDEWAKYHVEIGE